MSVCGKSNWTWRDDAGVDHDLKDDNNIFKYIKENCIEITGDIVVLEIAGKKKKVKKVKSVKSNN